MSDEMHIDGKEYISSKRASQLSGYAQDYIGQLARKALVDARRVGGLWYVSMESLTTYQKKAEEFKPEPPSRASVQADPETLVFFDGKEYLSAGRAAEITGYTPDYVGQLARSGTILSQQVGNRWYVEKQSIRTHKAEKDSLLAAVQSESVGLVKPQSIVQKTAVSSTTKGAEPLMNYFNENSDLMPVLAREELTTEKQDVETATRPKTTQSDFDSTEAANNTSSNPLRIRRLPPQRRQPVPARHYNAANDTLTIKESRKSYLPMVIGAAATIIIVLSVGYTSILKQNSVYAANIRQVGNFGALPADVSLAAEKIADFLEPYLTHELVYQAPSAQ